MQVLLTRPNSPLIVTPVPLGLGYLAHALKSRRGDQVAVLDGRRHRLGIEAIVAEALRLRPGAIGVTAMTFEAPEAIALIARLKDRLPDTPVILGGPHATGCGPSLLTETRADYLVLGEGEDALCELLDALEGRGDLAAIGGLVRRVNGEAGFNGPRGQMADPAGLAVDWDAIHPEQYFSSWRRNALNTISISHRRLPVFFTRGCPFGCSYCHHIFGRQYRTFDPEAVVAEMVRLRDRYRLQEFEIIDDTFNLKLDHAKTIMREIIGRKLECALGFTSGLRGDRMDEELLDLMVRARVYRVDYALESASPRIQKLVHKNLDLDRAREVVNLTAARRIVTGGYFMMGFPDETREEAEATVEYALSLRNHISSFFYLMPFPGTEVAESDPEVSRRVRAITFRDASGIALNLSSIPDAELQRLKQSAYRRFYFSPRRLLRIARDVPKNPRLFASALAILRMSLQENVNY
jgi:anaerobic magnesium-protoporphyrin IX monomethyl ester cyclase